VRERIRFHLDENMDSAIARALTRREVDVTTTTDADLRTRSDESQFGFAVRTGRTFVTGDYRLASLIGDVVEHPGVIFVMRARLSVSQQVRGLLNLYDLLSGEDLRNRVQWLTPSTPGIGH
jgi:predicted nuclease of predicted toxin-antitoxin system